jgi:hypothetical protein
VTLCESYFEVGGHGARANVADPNLCIDRRGWRRRARGRAQNRPAQRYHSLRHSLRKLCLLTLNLVDFKSNSIYVPILSTILK